MINLHVNGINHEINVPEEMPVLWVLRDYLHFTGTKYGCGLGVCGTCSILVDGDPIRSCITPVSQVQGKSIVTIEGVAQENPYLPLAWKELNVPQCGYCQPGQLVNALALLNKFKKPSDQDIEQAMAGNICRCGTYVRIRKAIHKAAALTYENESPLGDD